MEAAGRDGAPAELEPIRPFATLQAKPLVAQPFPCSERCLDGTPLLVGRGLTL